MFGFGLAGRARLIVRTKANSPGLKWLGLGFVVQGKKTGHIKDFNQVLHHKLIFSSHQSAPWMRGQESAREAMAPPIIFSIQHNMQIKVV